MKKQTKPTLQVVSIGEDRPNGHVPSVRPFAVKPFPIPQNPTRLDGVRLKIFLDRYAWKDEQGKPMEEVPEQMWARVARAIAQVEKNESLRKRWAEKFYYALSDFKFLPGGRILSAAGTGYEVTYYNCFVIPSPADSRGGIIDNLKVMMEIMSRAGGVGINLSSLRPHGARVHKVNGTSSGPVSWASLYSTGTHDVIQQGGSRRGALMLMLNDWHPDIEQFIEIKQDLSKINGANLSVCASDSFMEAVEQGLDWTLRFPDTKYPKYDSEWDGDILEWEAKGYPVKVYKTVKAKEIWDKICQAAWRSAEPGLVFMERYNKWSNTWYFEKIICVNPCITGDTWISTKDGIQTIKELYKKGGNVEVLTDSRLGGKSFNYTTQILKTGVKEVYRLETKEGYELKLTADHKVRTSNGWVKATDLKENDELLISNRKGGFGKIGTKEEGQILGWLVGDGTMKAAEAVLSFFGNEKQELAPKFATMVDTLVDGKQLNARAYPVGVSMIKGRDEARVSSTRLWRYAFENGITHGDKLKVPQNVVKGTQAMQKGFLQALFTADGHTAGTPKKGVSVRLTSISESLLKDVQRLLLNFGIASKIYQNRREESDRYLPDGQGGIKAYKCKTYHDLMISKENIVTFAREIGFLSEYKNLRIIDWLKKLARGPYRENFTVRFSRLVKLGLETVYDLTEPATSSFVANGLVIHNCGEQGLGAWSVCNLGALNLSSFVEDSQMNYEKLAEHAGIAIRFLDNVVDANYYFYPENEKQQKRIRRTGLGTMGLGDALIKMKLRYGSESLETIEKTYAVIRDAAYEASSDIAKEKGSFPEFNNKKYLQGYFLKQLPEHIRQKIGKQGMRNAVVLTQAPTGTTSLLAGVSSGIEPVYDFAFVRKDRTGESVMYHPIFKEWKDANPEGVIPPPYFVSANDLTPDDHVLVQAMIQKYTDSSISKTVNAPNSHTVKEVQKLYMDAYKLGCKGITYMRDGSRDGVLSHIETPAAPVAERPMILRGRTYKVSTPVGEAFITVNRDEHDQPFEVFVTVGRAGMHTMADAEAMGRLVSLSLRLARGVKGTDPKAVALKIVGQLRGIGGASSVGFGKNRVMSLADSIAKVLAEDLALAPGESVEQVPLNLTNGEARASNGEILNPASHIQLPVSTNADLCPECGSASFVMEEGCKKCHSCGYSMC